MAEDGFLGRWSRRKRGMPDLAPVPIPAVAPSVPLDVPAIAPGTEADSAASADAAPDAFDPASLPPLETLTCESDFTDFLRPQVPAALRQAALRRIWTIDPGIRDYIGPADYAWDYNAVGGVPGFSLEMGEEVARKLLALLTGPATPPDAEPARKDSPEDMIASAANPALAEPAVESGAPAAATPDSPPRPPESLVGGEPSPVLPPVAAGVPAPAEAAAPRRRHGGAVPAYGGAVPAYGGAVPA